MSGKVAKRSAAVHQDLDGGRQTLVAAQASIPGAGQQLDACDAVDASFRRYQDVGQVLSDFLGVQLPA